MLTVVLAVVSSASCSVGDGIELGPDDDGPIAPDEDEPDAEDAPGAANRIAASGCTFVPKIIIYSPAFNSLAPEIAATMDAYGARCAQYYFMLPAVHDQATCMMGEECLKLGARGTAALLREKSVHGNFHAMAEFHWHHWAAWIARSPGTRTWTLAAERFRRAMADAGFDVGNGDTWIINEIHTGVRRDVPGARANLREAIRALHRGDSTYVSPITGLRASTRRGVVLAVGQSQSVTNLGVYKDNLEDWLRDTPLWNDMRTAVQFFGQESYPSPTTSCAASASLASRSAATNAFTMHLARLGEAGAGSAQDAATAAARTFFDRAYFPLLGGVWPSDLYGDTQGLSVQQMMHFVSSQIYATRLWAANHPYPDARIGIAWLANGTAEDNRLYTERTASALMHAYSDKGSRAARACSPSGAFTWCRCAVAGAQLNSSWASAFNAW